MYGLLGTETKIKKKGKNTPEPKKNSLDTPNKIAINLTFSLRPPLSRRARYSGFTKA